jgi:hypothetical protein
LRGERAASDDRRKGVANGPPELDQRGSPDIGLGPDILDDLRGERSDSIVGPVSIVEVSHGLIE